MSRVIGRPRDVVTQRLDELIERGYVKHRGNRYEVNTKINVPNLQRHMRSNINIIKAAAKRLGSAHRSRSRDGPTLLARTSEMIEQADVRWWPLADIKRCLLARLLTGAKGTRCAHSEDFRL